MVIPINIPVKATPCNGAFEHAQGEIKQYLRTWQHTVKTKREFVLFTDTAAHDLNHKPRRKLGGQTAYRVYFGNERIRVNKRKRKSIYEWIKNLAVDILEKSGHDSISCLAWLIAAKKWLEKNDLIKTLKPGSVLPHLSSNLWHK
jgi:hypothetical protein